MLREWDGKPFQSVSAGDLDLETPEEKEEAKKQAEEHKSLFDAMKEALGDKVDAVRLSKRLKSHPVCLASEGEVSLEMEKVLNAMPADNKVKARRVLEINENHPIFATLSGLLDTDPDKLRDYSELLYDQALLIEGMAIEDPVAFSTRLCALMSGQ